MKQHKWHKEIKAWADGAEIEWRHFDNENDDEWYLAKNPKWDLNMYLFRIKPQPKTPKQSWDEELTRSYKETIIERLRTDNDFWIEVFTAYDNAKDDEIKPQPKEPQYLYVFRGYTNELKVSEKLHQFEHQGMYLGKIKLEVENDN